MKLRERKPSEWPKERIEAICYISCKLIAREEEDRGAEEKAGRLEEVKRLTKEESEGFL